VNIVDRIAAVMANMCKNRKHSSIPPTITRKINLRNKKLWKLKRISNQIRKNYTFVQPLDCGMG
jgi:hypothetical protein